MLKSYESQPPKGVDQEQKDISTRAQDFDADVVAINTIWKLSHAVGINPFQSSVRKFQHTLQPNTPALEAYPSDYGCGTTNRNTASRDGGCGDGEDSSDGSNHNFLSV